MEVVSPELLVVAWCAGEGPPRLGSIGKVGRRMSCCATEGEALALPLVRRDEV